MMNMQYLFERIADTHDGKVTAEEITSDHMYLRVEVEPQQEEVYFEVSACTDIIWETNMTSVDLVRVSFPDDVPDDDSRLAVLVSPIPSAILAVALR